MIKNKLVDYYMDKAFEYYRCFKNKKAIKCVDKVLFFDKNNIEAILSKALFYSALYYKEDSFKYYDLASELYGNSDWILFQRGEGCMNLEEYETAITYYKKILDGDSFNIDALYNIGLCLCYDEKPKDACEFYNKILKIDKNNIDALMGLSSCFLELKEYDDALDYIGLVLKTNPNNLRALTIKSNIYCDLGEFEKAMDFIELCIKLKPDLSSYILKYSLLADLGDYDASLKGFKNLLGCDIDDYNLISLYYLKYGHSLKVMKRFDDFLVLCDEFLEKYPHFPKDDILEEKEEVLKLLKE